MKIGFVVNDVMSESPVYTTTRLAMAATQMGHEAFLMGIGDFAYEPDGSLTARVRGGGKGKNYRSLERYLDDVQKPDVEEQPAGRRVRRRHAAQRPGRGRRRTRRGPTTPPWRSASCSPPPGVLVVNDPTNGSPTPCPRPTSSTSPRSCGRRHSSRATRTRSPAFISDLGGRAVLKPLQGSGGSGVFLVNSAESPNLSQIIEAIARDGYVVAQEYLPAAKRRRRADVRHERPPARGATAGSPPSAARAAATTCAATCRPVARRTKVAVTDEMLDLVEAVRPKLVADGMFLVGLDIVGDKLMEVNVFSPGGLGSCQAPLRARLRPADHPGPRAQGRDPAPLPRELTNLRLATL